MRQVAKSFRCGKCDERFVEPDREQKSQQAAAHRQQPAFDKYLLHQTPRASAERCTNGKFFMPLRSARK